MGSDPAKGYLGGKLLISMPDMADPRFRKCVILMVHHDDESAMGVVINRVAGQMQVGAAGREDAQSALDTEPVPVYFGGPVENERAIIVHSSDGREYGSTRVINDDFCITTTPEILEDFSRGDGPTFVILVLGYAGWGPGQLESELQSNSWLICDGDVDLVFVADDDVKWEVALKSIGINPSMLTATGGSA